MKIAIYSRGLEREHHQQLTHLINQLLLHNAEVLLYVTLYHNYEDIEHPFDKTSVFHSEDELDETVDCLISLGGDGTMLDAVTLTKDKGIPILGINFGRLWFLASIGREELDLAVDSLLHGTYVIDKRSLIHLESNSLLFQNAPFALNEFAIHKRDTSPMIKIHTYLNGEFLNTYWADGLIVATPTGSTGYNMSCNGPIVFPDSGSFVITPVAPHNLNVRPIIVPDTNIISFEVEGRTEEFICALDSRKEIVNKTIQLAVKKESFMINMIKLNENSFLSTLRSKLTWGLDKRN